ncbi:1,4-alpha-glucan branching protein GlgB [Clostridium grantii]|uniref:1,4-alpha-glucan branching enzyme GlgB n=1 Tax=Clostridium grantii DSM 8605 TaxID=1121316 RepID=A0A1M5X197_9CLOT|nr:1,4-alpha-glucan branching protein GlgB [Clostridium grantii]SHH93500.1 1,4-alpha-glucan branching enzyme [Clostridium grantii DSM 8605]
MQNQNPSSFEIHCFHEGTNYNSHKFLGAHIIKVNEQEGTSFSVWAPNAEKICVVGSFNNWDGGDFSMIKIKDSGIWNLFIPGVKEGECYMYEVFSKNEKKSILKADPYAFSSQLRPKNGSVIVDNKGYEWNDDKWIEYRENTNVQNGPINVYEVHLGSWKTHEEDIDNESVTKIEDEELSNIEETNHYYTYREMAETLPQYVAKMGYTHVELLPIMEHPLDDSWGYQTTGYFSVTPRYGSPKDFKYFVDKCHQVGIGVILDWAPSHFCKDSHGLYKFDGTFLFENDDPLIRENYDWGTANFDFDKPEVHSFLISNAIYWFENFHIDGLRVDAVANMLYLDYGKKSDMNIRNKYGGNENIEAVNFLKKLNEAIFKYVKNPLVIAEDSSTWPGLTSPTYVGGIGFNYKWNMGWMNDMLNYMQTDPIYKKWNHEKITFSLLYAFSENFMLPLSHDEVVHGKKSLLDKMPGDYWQKFANLRLFYGYMMAHPGKKVLFMGGEFGQFIEWNFKHQLDWLLLLYEPHKMLQDYVKSLNMLYKKEKAFWEKDHTYDGFEWIDHSNYEKSIISFMRKGKKRNEYLIFVCNFTPMVYYDYKVGVPEYTEYEEIFNSDASCYNGSGQLNNEILKASKKNWNNQKYSISMKIPPLAISILKAKRNTLIEKYLPGERMPLKLRSEYKGIIKNE